jgi:hypothetical protein
LGDLDLVHGVDDIVGTVGVDLVPWVRGADGNDDSTRCNTSLDTRRRVFKDNTSLGIEAEVGGSEEERIRERLSPLESRVIGRYTNFGDGDAGSVQASVTVRLGTGCGNGILAFGKRVDEFSYSRKNLDRHVDHVVVVIVVERVLVDSVLIVLLAVLLGTRSVL